MWITFDILIYPIYCIRWGIFLKKSSFLSLSWLIYHIFFFLFLLFSFLESQWGAKNMRLHWLSLYWGATFLLYYKSSSSKCFKFVIVLTCIVCCSGIFPWLIHSIWVPDPHNHHRQLHRTGPRTASPSHGQDPHVWTLGEHQHSLFSCHSLLIIKISLL